MGFNGIIIIYIPHGIIRIKWDNSCKMYALNVVVQSLSHVRLFATPMDCSPSGFSVHGISQARILEWVALPFSRASSQPRDWTCVSWTGRRVLYCWATKAAHDERDGSSHGNRASQGAPGVKNLPASVGGAGSIPEFGRSPGKGHGDPLQYSCLENPTDRGAWQRSLAGYSSSYGK